MSWPLVWRSIQVLAKQKKPIVSITRPRYSFQNVLQNFSLCPLALPIGLEPGLTEIIIEHSIKKLRKLDRLSLYCGGFMDPPPTHFPYRYAFGDSVPINANKAFFIEHNTVKAASKYDNVEEIFIQDLGFFEAYRDGLIPWIADSYKHLVTHLEQKTLRHRGFCSQVRNLEKMGFLSEKSININGHHVDMLSFSRRILAIENEKFPEVSSDTTLLKVIAEAREEKKSLMIIANYCSQYCLPSMGIMTASVLTHYLLEFMNHSGMENRYYPPHEYYRDDNTRQSLFTYMKSLGIRFQGDLITAVP